MAFLGFSSVSQGLQDERHVVVSRNAEVPLFVSSSHFLLSLPLDSHLNLTLIAMFRVRARRYKALWTRQLAKDSSRTSICPSRYILPSWRPFVSFFTQFALCDSFSLLIQIFTSPLFEYYLDLYDKDFQTQSKYASLLEALSVLGGESRLAKESARIKDSILADIKVSAHSELLPKLPTLLIHKSSQSLFLVVLLLVSMI